MRYSKKIRDLANIRFTKVVSPYKNGGRDEDIYAMGILLLPRFLIQPVDDHDLGEMKTEIDEIRKQVQTDFQLIAVKVDDWNRDLSPWKAPAVFGKDGFGDGAEDMLQFILRQCADRSKTYYIGGYSLAGLFSLWAAYQTDAFAGIAAAIPFNLVSEISCNI